MRKRKIRNACGNRDLYYGRNKIKVGPQVSFSASGHGYCAIAVPERNTLYAEWACEGDATGCRGEFTLTAGTGKFKGIKGSSVLLVRSPLHALVADMASGSIVTAEAGLVVLPKLTYEIPNR